MIRHFFLRLIFLCLTGLLLTLHAQEAHWPSFRGKLAQGLDTSKEGPLSWNLETGAGVRWRTPIAGLGLSSPVIWGNKIFVTTAVANDHDSELKVGLYGDIESSNDAGPQKWHLLCLARDTGKVIWNVQLCEGIPKIKRHPKSSHANATVATDGKHVVVFLGSEGLYCLDTEGQIRWSKDFGVMDSGYYRAKDAQWGFASSPIIHDGNVIVQCDVQENSFLASLDVLTGDEVWRTPRNEVPTWSTPAVFTIAGKDQVVVNGYKHIGGYEFDTGKSIWHLAGGGDIPVPTPIMAHGLIFVTNAHGRMAPVYAIRAGAKGAIDPENEADPHLAWWEKRRGNYMQTPIVVDDLLFCCQDFGIVSCFDAKTGKTHFRERLRQGQSGFGFTASPVSDGRKIYYPSEDGRMFVIAAAKTFQRLSENDLGAPSMASPALVNGMLYVRTRHHLIAIGSDP